MPYIIHRVIESILADYGDSAYIVYVSVDIITQACAEHRDFMYVCTVSIQLHKNYLFLLYSQIYIFRFFIFLACINIFYSTV